MFQIKHKNILELTKLVEDGLLSFIDGSSIQVTYIVMEYCEKGSLHDLVNEQKLSEEAAHFLFCQIVEGMAFLHTLGLYHRDLKLENIMLTSNYQVKIIDFGFCTQLKKQEYEQFVGTALFNPPEWFNKEKLLNDFFDVY